MKLYLKVLLLIASVTLFAGLADGQTYDYLPGDVNMFSGSWPPAVTGGDVTYLINSFRGPNLAPPCYLNNPFAPDPPGSFFWASADVSGDCRVAGNDVTILVRYFQMEAIISFCPEYPPTWPDIGDIPPGPPEGWPNCQVAPDEESDPFVPSPDPEITFWYGNPDGTPIAAEINSRLNVDIYVQTADSVYGGFAHIPLGVDNQYIDSLLSVSEGSYYYPFTEWDSKFFADPCSEPYNPPGLSSQSFIGWSSTYTFVPHPWLHSDTPLKVVTFVVKTADDPGLIGQTVSCLDVGRNPANLTLSVSDSLGSRLYDIGAMVSQVSFVELYDYLPGDANMAYGQWPPRVDIADLLLLINYFRVYPGEICLIDGFFAPGDVNGSCVVIGSDVARLVNYISSGIGVLEFCPDYPTAWPDEESLPPERPPGWPYYYCGPPVTTPPDDTVRVWYGNPDGSPISVTAGDLLDLDVYVQTTDTCFVGAIETHLGIDNQYIASFLEGDHVLYSPLSDWPTNSFSEIYGSPPNPAGWSSQSFLGCSRSATSTADLLNYPSPTRIMTLALQTVADPGLSGQTIACLGIGEQPLGRTFTFTDSTGGYEFAYEVTFSPIHFVDELTGSIAGAVSNEDGYPVQNVVVTAIGPTPASDITDAAGSYSLTDLDPGLYDVMFGSPNYNDTTVTSVLVESEYITPLNVVLTRIPVREPGWIYNEPRVVRDTVNANAAGWARINLTNYDQTYSVTIDSIKSSATWLQVTNLRNILLPAEGSRTLPVTLNMAGFAGEDVYGEITIWHSGPDSINTIPCQVSVTNQPSTGPIISVDRDNFDIALEPGVRGELKIRVYNTGDMPLEISGTTNLSPWLTPQVNSGTVAGDTPLDLIFVANTTGYADVMLVDDITIFSNAVNNPSLPVHVSATIAPEMVSGMYPLGDVNSDGWCNEADIGYLINYLFSMGDGPCMPAGDVNDDGIINILDIAMLISYLRGDGLIPVNACTIADNFRQHYQNVQAQLGQDIVGHRGDWVSIPVIVQNHDHHKTQIAFDITTGIIDNASVEDVTGIGFETYATIETNTTLDLNTITIADSVGSTAPVAFDSPTQIYNLSVHIDDNALLGNYDIQPTGVAANRGPTVFVQEDNATLLAPMFYGSTITIRPRVSLDSILGVPDIAYLPEMREFPLSLSITSDAGVGNTMNIFIMQLSSGDTVYSDVVTQTLAAGTHTYDFTLNWQIDVPGFYLIGAGIVSDLDEESGNYLTKNIYLTDVIQTGLPPAEGFGDARLNYIRYSDNSYIADQLPSNYASKNEDEELPEWDILDNMSYDQDNNKCVYMNGYNALGPHDDWLIYGPLTGVSLARPVVRFWETAYNWNDTSGSSHEYYVQYSSDFDVPTALAAGPIITHTPANHSIAPLIWTSVSIELPESIGVNDKVYFAWRYVGPAEQAKRQFDIWRVDYIEWFDMPENTYEYYPGDANMANAVWPPAVIGSDVTYLVNFFTGLVTNPACLINNEYMAADVNGTCTVIGSDVTRLVSYFRGQAIIEYCPDWEPAWHQPSDFPLIAPSGWPNCENLPATQKQEDIKLNATDRGERQR